MSSSSCSCPPCSDRSELGQLDAVATAPALAPCRPAPRDVKEDLRRCLDASHSPCSLTCSPVPLPSPPELHPCRKVAEHTAVAWSRPEQIDDHRELRRDLLSLHAQGIGPGSPEPTPSSSSSSTAAAARRARFPSTPSFPAVAVHAIGFLVSYEFP